MSDVATAALGFFLTVAILSYVLGDNVLFRVAAHLLIGVTAGFLAAVAWQSVLWPQLFGRMLNLGAWLDAALWIPLIMVLLMIGRSTPRLSVLGSLPMAFLVGLAAAVAVGGALTGTLIPQVAATAVSLSPVRQASGGMVFFDLEGALSNVIILIGTVTTLAYFHFGARPRAGQAPARPAWVAPLARVGEIFLAVAFGALYAGALAASLTALIDRVAFLQQIIGRLLP
jgi:hypothetical protein